MSEIVGWLADVRIETDISAAWGRWVEGTVSIEGREAVEEAVEREMGVTVKSDRGSDDYVILFSQDYKEFCTSIIQ